MKQYLKKQEGVSTPIAIQYEPVFNKTSTVSDYYIDGIWYDKNGIAYTIPIAYLPIVANVDELGNIIDIDSFDVPTLVEKSIVADRVRAEVKGKNSCTAWVNFDGTTTPPTIRDSYNVSQIVRTSTGVFEGYVKSNFDNINGCVNATSNYSTANTTGKIDTHNKFTIRIRNDAGTFLNDSYVQAQIFGGKN